MTDVSIEELAVFARYRRGKSSGSQARGVQRVLDLAPGCASAHEILALLTHDDPGDIRDAAIEFVQQFRVQVRDEHVDSLARRRYLRETGQPVDPQTRALADTATCKESLLAGLIDEAYIRDAVHRMVARLNARDEANGLPPYTWLDPD